MSVFLSIDNIIAVVVLVFILILSILLVIIKIKNNKIVKLKKQIDKSISDYTQPDVEREIVVKMSSTPPEREESVLLLTQLLNVGFTNLSSTELGTRLVYLLKDYYNVSFVTFYVRGVDGWFSTLSTNIPNYRVTKTERYYNKISRDMSTDSKVTVLGEYGRDDFLQSINIEYSNFTFIKQNGKIIGALLLEHTNKNILENNENQFKLYDKVFNTTSLVLSHVIEVGDLVKKVSTDQLTDVYNRRYIDVALDEEVIKHSNLGQSFHIAMMDIDYFKKFNDTYGHQFGDKVLQEVSKYIKSNLGIHSWVARYGGEEFLIFIANSTTGKVYTKIDTLREGIADLELEYEGTLAKVTASFGISRYPRDGGTKEDIISNADKALYQSKNEGRNKVTVWGESY